MSGLSWHDAAPARTRQCPPDLTSAQDLYKAGNCCLCCDKKQIAIDTMTLKQRSRRGSGRPTLSDVAGRAGVGTISVARALREPERVSPELRLRIDRAVRDL